MPVVHIFVLHNADKIPPPNKGLKLYQVSMTNILQFSYNYTSEIHNNNNSDISFKCFLSQCPVYKKPQRTYMLLITPLWLQTLKNPDYWILRGVALLCDNK